MKFTTHFAFYVEKLNRQKVHKKSSSESSLWHCYTTHNRQSASDPHTDTPIQQPHPRGAHAQCKQPQVRCVIILRVF